MHKKDTLFNDYSHIDIRNKLVHYVAKYGTRQSLREQVISMAVNETMV